MEPPGRDWPAQLSEIVNANGTRRYEVINAAFPGRGLRSNIVHLEERVLKFHPDIVILYSAMYPYMNPKFQEYREKKAQRTPVKQAKISGFSLQPRIVSKIKQLVKGLLPRTLLEKYQEYVGLSKLRAARAQHAYEYLVDDVSAIELEPLKKDLRDFHNLCTAHGVQLILATHASHLTERNVVNGWRWTPYFTEESFKNADARLNRVLVEFANENCLPSVDIAGIVPKDDAHMEDFTHFTESGATMAAEAFAEKVLSLDRQGSGLLRRGVCMGQEH
jgi:hypothetical protein